MLTVELSEVEVAAISPQKPACFLAEIRSVASSVSPPGTITISLEMFQYLRSIYGDLATGPRWEQTLRIIEATTGGRLPCCGG